MEVGLRRTTVGEALLALRDVVDERVGTQLRDRGLDLVRRLQLARGRAAQVGARHRPS